MALVFPTNPTPNQTYSSGSSAVYRWNGLFWDILILPTSSIVALSSSVSISSSFADTLQGGTAIITSSTPSTLVESGSFWWNNDDGNLYIQVATPTGSTYAPAVGSAVTSISASTTLTASVVTGRDWISAGTCSIGAVTTAPTKGTIVYDKVRYRRINTTTYEVEYNYAQSTTGGGGSGTYIFRLPPGITFDSGVTLGGTAAVAAELAGNISLPTKGKVYTASGQMRSLVVTPITSTTFILLANDITGVWARVTNAYYALSNDGMTYKFSFYTSV